MADHTPNPKEFYDQKMTSKLGTDYEAARWAKNEQQAAQYEMTADIIRRYVTPLLGKAKRILEVGPGPGTWTKIVLETNPKASFTLVDISTTMLSQARSALATYANISFVESDLLRFTSDESFDGFFSSRAIEYMPDKAAVAAKIASLLSPGAYGAIITKTPKPFFDRLRGRSSGSFHSGQISAPRLSNELRVAGLRVVSTHPVTATVPGIGSAALNRFVYRCIRRLPLSSIVSPLTESYCVIFQKP